MKLRVVDGDKDMDISPEDPNQKDQQRTPRCYKIVDEVNSDVWGGWFDQISPDSIVVWSIVPTPRWVWMNLILAHRMA